MSRPNCYSFTTFDLLVDHFTGKLVNHHMHSVMLSAFNDEDNEVSLAGREAEVAHRERVKAFGIRNYHDS